MDPDNREITLWQLLAATGAIALFVIIITTCAGEVW